MTKRRILFYTITSIAVGVFLVAVTGAAMGYFDAGNDVLAGRPVVKFWQALSADNASAALDQAKAPLAADRGLQGSRFEQDANQLEMQSDHFCERGDDG